MSKIDKSFYRRKDVVKISKELLGKVLCSKVDGLYTSGVIVETEAYQGATDKACHAYQNKRTKRTEVFFNNGGIAYVYLCYGIHHLFNVITNSESEADAVLIRAVEPVEGIDLMIKRRKLKEIRPNLTAGPGILSEAMGIRTHHNGVDLQSDLIWIEDRNINLTNSQISSAPRVGCESAGNAGYWPWRFRIKGNKWTSPGKSRLTALK
ncbi:MAG: DNA-3-methyladenine glycosylase [Chitinophagales bacterium]|nr:DNA-3-methyladenine glycosylase [Chitinophagales bacterium]